MEEGKKIKKYQDDFIGFLRSAQRADGGFDDFSGREAMAVNALLLLFLPKKSGEILEEIRKRAASFILRYKKAGWVFSDDFAFNFLLLAALAKHDAGIFGGRALAEILGALTNSEVAEGGPYYSSADREKADLAANAAVGVFLSCLDVSLPSLDELAEKAIGAQDFSASAASPCLAIYLISEFYRGPERGVLAEYLLEKISDRRISAGDEMLCFLSLLNLGCRPAAAAEKEYFLRLAESGRLFGAEKLLDRDFDNKEQVAQILNSALFLGVLTGLEKMFAAKYGKSAEEEKKETEMIKKIAALAEKRFFSLPEDFKKFANQEIGEVARRNSDRQMPLMPYYFRLSLGGKGKIFSDDFIAQLGLANAFFWTAFIIYDDFLDEEGEPKLISTANIYAREFTGFFRTLFPPKNKFNDFFTNLMDKLDAANTWEALYCRAKVSGQKIKIPEKIPDYGDYEVAYEPASAHILGSAAMLAELGFAVDSEETKNLIDYFRHYLIAMQFNDDIYDWEEDLRRGQLSTVIAMFLRDWREIHPKAEEIDLEKDLLEARKLFCFTTLGKASAEALRHTAAARQALSRLKVIENPAPLEKFINLTENAARQAFSEQQKTKEFLGIVAECSF
jgi:hypothetical protein